MDGLRPVRRRTAIGYSRVLPYRPIAHADEARSVPGHRSSSSIYMTTPTMKPVIRHKISGERKSHWQLKSPENCFGRHYGTALAPIAAEPLYAN